MTERIVNLVSERSNFASGVVSIAPRKPSREEAGKIRRWAEEYSIQAGLRCARTSKGSIVERGKAFGHKKNDESLVAHALEHGILANHTGSGGQAMTLKAENAEGVWDLCFFLSSQVMLQPLIIDRLLEELNSLQSS